MAQAGKNVSFLKAGCIVDKETVRLAHVIDQTGSSGSRVQVPGERTAFRHGPVGQSR